MNIKTKICYDCGQEKEISEFGKDIYNRKGGYMASCKDCYNLLQRERYRKRKKKKSKYKGFLDSGYNESHYEVGADDEPIEMNLAKHNKILKEVNDGYYSKIENMRKQIRYLENAIDLLRKGGKQ